MSIFNASGFVFFGEVFETKVGVGVSSACDFNQCKDGICNAGECVESANKPNGTPCDDEFFCTVTDTCQNGTCDGTGNPCSPPTSQCNEDTDTCYGCEDDYDCVLCEKCEGGACVPQSTDEDLKDQCSDGDCVTGFCDGAGACGIEPQGTACTDDGNICTDNECGGAGTCIAINNINPCDDGNACTHTDTCSGGTCSGITYSCDDDKVCTDDVCNGDGTCTNTNNTAPCDDGSYCTQTDSCQNGACVGSGEPCPQGYSCDEDQDACYQIKVSVGDGSGFRGSTANLVEVSLDNPYDEVRGIEIDICDIDNYLSCTACETTNRTSGFLCETNEVNGCCRILLASLDADLIEEGNGPIFTLKYNVSAEALSEECRNLNPENMKIADAEGDIIEDVITEPGEFCFSDCTDNQQCDDNNVCTDDSCESGSCVYTNNNNPCDDGNACTENDICGSGSCQPGDPIVCDDGNFCTDDSCNPANGQCVYTPNDTNTCSDNDLCTSNDRCSAGSCVGDLFVCDDGNFCTDDSCNPANGQCVFTPNDANPCTDNDLCTSNDHCSAGSCVGDLFVCDDGNFCTDDSCNPANGQCIYTNDDTNLCDDGLYCTQTDTCEDGVCVGSGDPCADDENFCNGVEYCTEDADTFVCNSTGDPCGGLTCIELDETCDGSEVMLIIGDSFGTPGTIDISLTNELDLVKNIIVNVCDKDQRPWLHIDTNLCTLTVRAPEADFTCKTLDLGGGCVQVLISSDTATIATGTGPIAQLSYTLDANAPSGEFADLFPENAEVKDDLNNTLPVTPIPGRIGAVECTIDAHCNDGIDCTDDSCDTNLYVCHNTPNDGRCSDSIVCTVDICNPAIGCVFTPEHLNCDDSIECTIDTCDPDNGNPETGCLNTPDNTLCDDSVDCTDDTCYPENGDPTTGCLFTVNDVNCYDNNPCTSDICDDTLGCQNNPLPDGTSCNDGYFCNGADTCSDGSCASHTGDPCPEGTTCNESFDACTSPPPPPPVYTVSISPASATVESAETIQFTATTKRNGATIAGSYKWEIVQNAGIGSSLNSSNGLYTAGDNDTNADIVETIKVTDTNQNVSTTAKVTIKAKAAVCEIVIEPSSATVKSNETVQFSALTTRNGVEEEGTYQWAMASTTIESTINASTGLYTAGTTDAEVTDTIQVTDTAHDNITATALVTVTQATPPVCNITIEPSDTTVDSGATITFTATVEGEDCLAPDFDWEVETDIHSEITPGSETCAYQAGSNTTGILVTDTITVTDVANGTSESVTITVLYGRITGVFPPVLLGSRWLPLFHIMIIFGEDTGFNVTSTPSFTPDTSITTIGQIGLGDLMGVLILLAPNAETGPVDLAVTTTNGAGQEVTFTKEEAFTINMLPFLLDESENRF